MLPFTTAQSLNFPVPSGEAARYTAAASHLPARMDARQLLISQSHSKKLPKEITYGAILSVLDVIGIHEAL